MISMEKIMLLIHLAIPTFSSERLNPVDKYFYGGLWDGEIKNPPQKNYDSETQKTCKSMV
jgi:hypothetical protein